MKLSELDPHWVIPNSWAKNAPPFYVGLSFMCPHCMTRRMSVRFYPPVDPDGLVGTMFEWTKTSGAQDGELVWDRRGDTFEDITLDPSLNFAGKGHWHGHIINGEALTQ